MRARLHKPQSDNTSSNQSLFRRKVMPKLIKNKPGDLHEQEADRAADEVVKKSSSDNSLSSASKGAVQAKPLSQTLTPRLQLKEDEDLQSKEEENVQLKEPEMSKAGMADPIEEEDPIRAQEIQTKEEDVQTKEFESSADASVQDAALQSTKGEGSSLPSDTLTEMNDGFGADFSGVKIHTGTQAEEMNSSLGAQAFTHQNDIYFNKNKFAPDTKEGKTLLAHELAHTVQQGAAAPGKEEDENEVSAQEVTKAKAQAEENPEMQQKGKELAVEVINKAKEQQPNVASTLSESNEKLPEQQNNQEEAVSNAIKQEENATTNVNKGEEEETETGNVAGQEKVQALDKAVEQKVNEKTKADAPVKEQKKEMEALEMKEPEAEKQEGAKKEEDPGPEGVKEDYENPPPVKDAKVEEATDKAGEGVGIDEEANVNVEGLIMTAQQFRDQGKESVDRAKAQTEHRLIAEKKMQQVEKKVEGSDKALQTAEKNTLYREQQIPKIMDKALETSKQRQGKVAGEVGTYTAEYNKNKGTANDLKKESADLTKGSKKNSNPEEKDSGELTAKYEEMSSGSATMADGISGGGSTAAKLAGDAKEAKAKNTATEKNLNESKADIQKSKQKISSEKGRNNEAKSKMKSLTPKFQSSKKQEEQLTAEGMGLMKTSFEMENETHRAQYFYYKDMNSIEGTDEMIMQEEMKSQSELSNGPESLMFRYSTMKSEGERDAFLASLSESDRMMLGMQLEAFNMNFDSWIEAKKLELGERVEKRRADEIDGYNIKRNQGLQSPLNKATKNIDKISKSGLLWTSMTKSLEAMWEGLKNITWADVGKIGWAMINPLETYRTIADAVGGIWKDLSNWKGFSDDPVGMILQKGSSVGVKLLTIAGVVTGLLLALSIVTGIAAVFVPPLWAVVAWLGSATATMTTVTFWIGVVTAALSVMSGIKNIFNVHTAKTAEEIYQGNAKIKKDAANTAAGVMGVVGAKSVPTPINADKIGKFKNAAVRTWKASSGFIKGGVRKIPRLVSAAFKKDTWTGLFASFKKFTAKKSDDWFGGNKKKITGKTDHIPDAAPKKTLKNVDGSKAPPTSKVDNKLPEKQKPVNVDSKPSTKKPDIETDVPVTKNIPETETPYLKKVDSDLPEGNIKKMDGDVEKPKNKQFEGDEKTPKSKAGDTDNIASKNAQEDFDKASADFDPSTATTKQKGNFGEIASQNNMLKNSNLKRIDDGAPKGLDDKLKRGIDGIYESNTPPPKYIIEETKFGSSQLNQQTKTGPQMSDTWVRARLEKQVGPDKARDIIKEMRNGNVDKVLSKVDVDGKVTTHRIDAAGKISGTWP